MATATSSPFTKDKIRTQMLYYFDDDRIAILQKNGSTGEWDSISDATVDADGDRMRLHYHSRYGTITDLESDLNVEIGVKYGLHLALLDYVRARIMEDDNDEQKAAYYYMKFQRRIKQYPYRKSSVRGIKLYNLT
jgi:hypothetical protein